MRNLAGVLFAIGANFLWGLVFVVPYALPGIDPFLIPFGRFAVYGILSIVLFLLFARRGTSTLKKSDWQWAAVLTLAGNIVYYTVLVFAIRLSGVAMAALITGILPITMSLYGNWLEQEFRFRKLLPSLGIILLGIIILNSFTIFDVPSLEERYHVLAGAGLAFVSLALWTWYGVKNAQYLKRNSHINGQMWTTAIGIMSLPSLLVFFFLLAVSGLWSPEQAWATISAPAAWWTFVGVSLLLGVVVSWLSYVLWNVASKVLPISLVGQLIVFESISSIAYASLVDGAFPPMYVILAVVITLSGVLLGIRTLHRQGL